MMSDKKPRKCPECKQKMIKLLGAGSCVIISGSNSVQARKEADHSKKVKDKERAIKMRKKEFGHDAVGDPVDAPDPRHIIQGRTLGGRQFDVDKKELTKALSRDDYAVQVAQKALRKSQKKK